MHKDNGKAQTFVLQWSSVRRAWPSSIRADGKGALAYPSDDENVKKEAVF